MPLRLASSPDGHGFAALWVEFLPRPPRNEKSLFHIQLALDTEQALFVPMPSGVTLFGTGRYQGCQLSEKTSGLPGRHYRRTSAKKQTTTKPRPQYIPFTKVLEKERGARTVLAGLGRERRTVGGASPRKALLPLPNLKISSLPLSTHSAASWRRHGTGSASCREGRFPARRRCRTWGDPRHRRRRKSRSWHRGERKRRSCS